MSTIEAGGHGAVYDRGYRPYDGPRGRRGAATFALYKASMRRALGIRRSWRQKVAPFVLLGVVTIPAIVNVGIGYVTRDQLLEDRIEIITYRDYVGVSSALLLFVALVAPDVMCPDRRQHVLPLMFARPLTGRRLRRWPRSARSPRSCSRSRSCPRSCCSSATCSSATAPSTTSPATSTSCGRCRSRSSLLAVYYAVIGVAIASLTDRRIVAGAAIIGLFLVTSIASGIIVGDDFEFDGGSIAALINVLGVAAVPARPRVPRPRRPRVAAHRRRQRWPARRRRRTSSCSLVGVGVLLRRYRWVER